MTFSTITIITNFQKLILKLTGGWLVRVLSTVFTVLVYSNKRLKLVPYKFYFLNIFSLLCADVSFLFTLNQLLSFIHTSWGRRNLSIREPLRHPLTCILWFCCDFHFEAYLFDDIQRVGGFHL